MSLTPPFFPSDAGLAEWYRRRRALAGAPSEITDDGTPVFRAEAATTAPSTTLADMMPPRHVAPFPSDITGSPDLPPEPNDLAWARQLGGAFVPKPSTSSYIPAVESMRGEHPRAANWLENFIIAQSSADPDVPFSGIRGLMEYRRAQDEAQRGYEAQKVSTGLGLTKQLDAMAQARTDKERAAALNESQMAENYAQAAASRALADQRTNPFANPTNLAALRTELANLESVPESQRTPEQVQRIAGLRAGLASTTQRSTPYGTSAFGMKRAALEEQLGRALTYDELLKLEKETQDERPPMVLYPTVEGNQVIYLPPAQAQGKPAPRTLYDNGVPSVGGREGLATTAPPAIDNTTRISMAGWEQAISGLDKVLPQIKKLGGSLGPFAGRVTLGEIEKLGGLGATPDQIRLAVDLRRLLMSQAFAEGGKQLTETEKEEFKALNPAMSDTLQQALIKAEQSRQYLVNRYNTNFRYLAPRQQQMLQQQGAGAGIVGGSAAAPAGNVDIQALVDAILTPKKAK